MFAEVQIVAHVVNQGLNGSTILRGYREAEPSATQGELQAQTVR